MATRFLVMDGKIVKDTRTGMPVALTDNIFTNVTYDVLKTMRDNGHLLSGEQYRIVDFVTTTSQENTQSAGHPFDIIVVADSANTLNENARAVAHESDTYFANCKLSAWEIKYCFDNDKTRFWWADETNGKGVIYYMKDEYGNECPYDFKNIQFKRWATDDEIDNDDKFYSSWNDTGNNFRWCYTFMANGTTNDTWADASTIKPYRYMSDEGGMSSVNNSIKPFIQMYEGSEEANAREGLQWLNNIVLYGSYEDNPTFGDNYEYNYIQCPFGNKFGINNHSMTLGKAYACHSNTLGNDCVFNTFGSYCRNNAIGDSCSYNTIGDGFSYNTIGNMFGTNTIGDGSSYNAIGNDCELNTFGRGFSFNTIGNACRTNTIGEDFSYNTIGNACSSNTLGNYCYGNIFGYNCSSNTLGDKCESNILDSEVQGAKPQPTTGSQTMRGVHIHYGVTGQFTVVRGASYTQDVRTANDVTITV